ncbi:hypothetical protein BT96DRAFT_936357 [Gymnopus androsaceus JB14]|uniref:Fatty acid desaturase domain-containing protein n=1 Tax=Gymnopus androsaceus JB14 TaxID=1447944 RepID=A0A6A4I0H6_9AGAR|nr:hypothetical protein BT96DRAFT_936357 [Gymnopus androsaceus JB14]
MLWYQVFSDGVEYEARAGKPFVPPNITIKQVWEAVPKHLFARSTTKSLFYIVRHLLVTYLLYVFAQNIDTIVSTLGGPPITRPLLKAICWLGYWGFQGFAFAGIWCIGHDAGHGALSDYGIINDILGLALHAFVLTPYHAWRFTHRAHHKGTQSVERDETYMPFTRKDFKLPDGKVAVKMDYTEILEETPAFTLFKLFVRQFFGFQLYLLHNRKGNRKYPAYTSLFKPQERMIFLLADFFTGLTPSLKGTAIILSNLSIMVMFTLIGMYIKNNSWNAAMKYYFLPWLFQHNWMVMFTYLQHSDPNDPVLPQDHCSAGSEDSSCTISPPITWLITFSLRFHSITFHEATEAIKPVLGEYYSYDSTGVIAALWRSFTQCVFIEDEGDILFYKNQYGESVIDLDEKAKSKLGEKPVDGAGQEEMIIN